MKRWRLARLLPRGLSRRSTMFTLCSRASLPGLLHAHVPFDEPPHLPLGVAAGDHPLDELGMLALRLGLLLAAEADDRQQILDLAEHTPFDDLSDLLVRRPG